MFFTSSLKIFNSAYLSLKFQMNVSYFILGPLILGPTFSALAVMDVVMVCITTQAALANACAI